MPTINRDWHLAHKMPPNPTLDERIEWHLEHRKHCACRTDLPKSILSALEDRGIDIPEPLSGESP